MKNMDWINCKDKMPNDGDIVLIKFNFTRNIGKAEFKNDDFFDIIDEYRGMSGAKLKKSNINQWSIFNSNI